ncbi:MAG: PQQ-dependent sugar dehydrogenase [Deltaproteobacteria bacterium]|nr:PQQ-dependent sugar dehydrogenase [Deltaproteobacteria bacterium]
MSIAHAPVVAVGLPAGFQDRVVVSGLTQPTCVAFAPDGRIFVGEKSGLIKVFDGPDDPSATIFADLRTNVHNFWDRGLAGLALHPNFPATPYVYVTYTLDAAIGGTPPRWGMPGATTDGCGSANASAGNCPVAGRLSRLQAAGSVMTGSEQVLLESWCQQFPSHSVDDLAFDAEGALYVSAGEGANFFNIDFGQWGAPANPCGDPPAGAGTALAAPDARGGALRAQSLRRALGEPALLNGAVLRLDPVTGQALPTNPYVGSGIPNAERVIAFGLRNPFRIAFRPGTHELYVGDVGWSGFDEINRIGDTTDAAVENFGWPCYEGPAPQVSYQAAQLTLCKALYQQAGAVAAPLFAYAYGQSIVPGEACGTGGNTISGLAFYSDDDYPAVYRGALFFADYSRDCLWMMPAGADGRPLPARRATFATGVAGPVDLAIGPDGDLYYVELAGGAVRRVHYYAEAQPPQAVIQSDATNGPLPLTIAFSAAATTDTDVGDTLSYAWDLDGDGDFDDSSAIAPSFTYASAATVTVRLRVTDSFSLTSIAAVVITAGNSAPRATISAPSPASHWAVGDAIAFAGSATDPDQGALPDSALSWSVVIHHCPQDCHNHPLQDFPAIAGGSFVAPDHDYPSFLEIRLTATDSGGLSDSTTLYLYPRTVALTFTSTPSGLALSIGSSTRATPFQHTAIVGSAQTVSAPAPQTLAGTDYSFASWADGGGQTHGITVPAAPLTLSTTFSAITGPYCGDGHLDAGEQCDDGGSVGGDCCDASCQVESGCAPSPTASATRTASATPTRTASPTATRTSTATATPTTSATATRTASASTTPTLTATATRTPSQTPSATPTRTATPTPSGIASPTPTVPAAPAIAGALRYYRGDRPLGGATVALSGVAPAEGLSNASGTYAFAPLAAGAWAVTPRLSGAAHGAITARDAAWALQAASGQRSFDVWQQLACDVDGDGVLTQQDALRILQRALGDATPFGVAQFCGSDWLFDPLAGTGSGHPPLIGGSACAPGRISFPALGSGAAADFRAVLLGDCTGNWLP